MITGDVNVQRSVSGAVQLPKASAACGLTEEVKQALLTIAQKVAYIDENGQTYYDALYNALYPPATLVSISAVFNQGSSIVYDTDTLESLKQYLTVTGAYDDGSSRAVTDYTLSGTLTEGTSSVTVTYGGKTASFSVTVTHKVAQMTGISAVFTQGSAVIYDNASLDDLKPYLVVTASYDNGTSAAVSGYTLSGTLAAGTSTITATYSGYSDTFDVTVTEAVVTYTVTNNLIKVTTNNNAATINRGQSYSATLTPESGTVFTSVTVMMGGTDITATAYGEGAILITNVTGDIVITATAGAALVYQLPEEKTFANTTTPFDTGFAMYPDGDRTLSVCIDFSVTAQVAANVNLVQSNVGYGYRLWQNGATVWRVNSNQADAVSAISGLQNHAKLVYVRKAGERTFNIYALKDDEVKTYAASGYGYYPAASANTVTIGPNNANWGGAVHDFCVYAQELASEQIESYLRTGAI